MPWVALLLAAASGSFSNETGDPSSAQLVRDPITVFYPAGECLTGVVEIEVYDREHESWQPHPGHPRVLTDSCEIEDAGQLLHELRVRCVDPTQPISGSEWKVGADVFKPRAVATCGRRPVTATARAGVQIEFDHPEPGGTVRPVSRSTPIAGRVRATDRLIILVQASLLDGSKPAEWSERLTAWAKGSDRPISWRIFGPAADHTVNRAGTFADLASALDAARTNLSAFETSAAPSQIMALVAGGAPKPLGGGSGTDPHGRARLWAALERLRDSSFGLHVVEVAAESETETESELRNRVHTFLTVGPAAFGSFSFVADADEIEAIAASVLEPRLTRIAIRNLTTGDPVSPMGWTSSGRFSGELPLVAGANEVEIFALVEDGRSTTRVFEVEFDVSALRGQLRSDERERIDRIRSRRKGQVEIEVEGLP